jgi:hypothetical protein
MISVDLLLRANCKCNLKGVFICTSSEKQKWQGHLRELYAVMNVELYFFFFLLKQNVSISSFQQLDKNRVRWVVLKR